MPFDGAVRLSPVQRHLLAAADYIRENGWCQRTGGDRGGPVCLFGAIHYSGEGPTFRPVRDSALDLVSRQLPPTARFGVISWNDAPGRTKEEVIAVLEAAARAG